MTPDGRVRRRGLDRAAVVRRRVSAQRRSPATRDRMAGRPAAKGTGNDAPPLPTSIPHPAVSAPAGRARRCAFVGLSTSELREPERIRHDPASEPAGREIALGMTYPDVIRRAGAVPVVIPPMDRAALEPLLDGLLGPVPVGRAGPAPELLRRAAASRARADRAAAGRVRDRARARGAGARHSGAGDLSRPAGAQRRARRDADPGPAFRAPVADRPPPVESQAGSRATHDVTLEDSLAAQCLGLRAARVNSFHHQAVDRLGDGLRAVGWAPDGVVEAIEDRPRVHGRRAVARREHGPRARAGPPARGVRRGRGRGRQRERACGLTPARGGPWQPAAPTAGRRRRPARRCSSSTSAGSSSPGARSAPPARRRSPPRRSRSR